MFNSFRITGRHFILTGWGNLLTKFLENNLIKNTRYNIRSQLNNNINFPPEEEIYSDLSNKEYDNDNQIENMNILLKNLKVELF